MATISWGKPKIVVGADLAALTTIASGSTKPASTNAKFYLLTTPVEDSTNLTATQGDKVEAKIEGGEAEDVKIKAATFELTMEVRMAKNRHLPPCFYKSDGSYADKVAYVLQPESPEAPGFYCASCSVSIIESYTAADGAKWEITLNPVASTNYKAIEWGIITLSDETEATEDGVKYKKYNVAKGDIGTGADNANDYA